VAHDRLEECEKSIKRDDEAQDKREEELQKLAESKIKEVNEIQKQRQDRREAFAWFNKARKAVEASLQMRLTADGLTVADVLEKLQEARDDLQEAIRKDPTYAEALQYRGEVMHRMGEYDVAEEHFKEALKHSSDSGPASFGASLATLAVYMIQRHAPDLP